MRLVANTFDGDVVLKTYRSYLDLDRDLSQFHSIAEIKAHLDLEDEETISAIYDGNNVICDPELARKILSFYENKKGDEFMDWIIDSAEGIEKNKNLLYTFCEQKRLEFTREEANNPEGKRLCDAIIKMEKELEMYGDNFFGPAKKRFKEALSEYLKKDGEYNYAYMRKFAMTLRYSFGFTNTELNIEEIEITEEKQDKVLKDYETAIHNARYAERQVTIDDLIEQQPVVKTKRLEEEKMPVYDENGIKNDEKEFLEEFAVKKNLHL